MVGESSARRPQRSAFRRAPQRCGDQREEGCEGGDDRVQGMCVCEAAIGMRCAWTPIECCGLTGLWMSLSTRLSSVQECDAAFTVRGDHSARGPCRRLASACACATADAHAVARIKRDTLRDTLVSSACQCVVCGLRAPRATSSLVIDRAAACREPSTVPTVRMPMRDAVPVGSGFGFGRASPRASRESRVFEFRVPVLRSLFF